jgi:2-haloacid dehalogenase
MDRRTFTQHVAELVTAGALVSTAARVGDAGVVERGRRGRVEAVLFDALAVFDARPVGALAEQLFPGRGAELAATWRARQFEYAWLRVLSGDYADFWRCTEDALRYAAAAAVRLDVGPAQREQLLHAFLELRPWPDVPAALDSLRGAGVRLGLLSNFTPAMLDASVRTSGLDGVFEHAVSTDRARTYKPDPRAYQLGVEALRLPRERIVFAAFAGWDAAGAKRFGYPTYWVNRLQAPAEELDAPAPDGVGRTLADLSAFVSASSR